MILIVCQLEAIAASWNRLIVWDRPPGVSGIGLDILIDETSGRLLNKSYAEEFLDRAVIFGEYAGKGRIDDVSLSFAKGAFGRGGDRDISDILGNGKTNGRTGSLVEESGRAGVGLSGNMAQGGGDQGSI